VRVLAGVETLGEQVERLSLPEASYFGLHKRQRRALALVRRQVSRGSR
jgi:hypothetical protein